MIRVACALIILFFVSQVYSQINKDNFAYIDSIYVSKTDWDILVDVSVSCTQFEKQGYPIYCIKNKKTLTKICKEISQIKDKVDYAANDFRCKLYFYRKDTLVSTICCNRDNVLVDGFYYIAPSKLIKLLDSCIKMNSNHRITRNLYLEPCVGGLAGIYEYLGSQSYRFTTSSRLKVFANIEVDKNGKVTSVDITGKNCEIPMIVKNTLNTILTQEIEWKANPNRVPNEHFLITLVIEPNITLDSNQLH